MIEPTWRQQWKGALLFLVLLLACSIDNVQL